MFAGLGGLRVKAVKVHSLFDGLRWLCKQFGTDTVVCTIYYTADYILNYIISIRLALIHGRVPLKA